MNSGYSVEEYLLPEREKQKEGGGGRRARAGGELYVVSWSNTITTLHYFFVMHIVS